MNTASRASGDLFRVALLIPSSNTVMERDFHRALGESCAIGTTRIYLEQVTRHAETAMVDDELPRALRLVSTLEPEAVVFGCTSAGSLGGLAGDAATAGLIAREAGAPAITVVGAMLAELRAVRARRVAVLTPYEADLTASVASCIAQAGHTVAASAGMGIVQNLAIGRVTPAEIVEFVTDRMRGVEADSLFLSCTNWQAVDALASLRASLGIPIFSSNQATIAAVQRLATGHHSAPVLAEHV